MLIVLILCLKITHSEAELLLATGFVVIHLSVSIKELDDELLSHFHYSAL